MRLRRKHQTCGTHDQRTTGPRLPCTMPKGHGGDFHEYHDPGTGNGDDRTFRWTNTTDGFGAWLTRLVTVNRSVHVHERSYECWEEVSLVPAPPATAQYVSSRLRDSDLHLPALDIDTAALLVPSKTPGHHHLLIDKPMPWRTYKRLLRALAAAGVIEKSWARAAIASRQSLLALPPGR